MEVSLRMGVIVKVLECVCVCEIEFGLRWRAIVLKCESECLRECKSEVCTTMFEPFKIVPGLAESSPVVEENI